MTPEMGDRVNTTCDLAGTSTASSCTANVNLPATGMSLIQANATIDRTIARMEPLYRDGERVLRVDIAASFGAASRVTYVTESGRRITEQ